jgi:hypothetical protein
MALLFNSWFPSGGTPKDYTRLDCNDVGYTPVNDATLAIPEVVARLAPVTINGEAAYRFTKFFGDPGISAGPKVQLAPAFTTVNRDPITNWAGSSASRRWYRFKFMLPDDHIFLEWANPPGSQRQVVFQVHDTVDTTPADFDTGPSLWLRTMEDGTLWFEVTSCSATQTTSNNFTIRKLAQVKAKPGVPVEVVLFVKWAYDNTGAMTIWQDRRKVWEETGIANCKNDDPARGGAGNFSILCNYCKDEPVDRTVYHYGLQIGDESYADYNAFATACGAGLELERAMLPGVSVG